ncbi:MAG: hypothetical protein WCY67_11405 [Acidithiobacillus sp.]
MNRKAALRTTLFLAVASILSGCAASLPKVTYTGPALQNSAFKNKTVALITTTAGDQFNDPECLTEFTKACRNVTLASKPTVNNYNDFMKEALLQEGAKVVTSSPADITIHTHMIATGNHRYMFLLDYNLGRSVGMSLIPIVGMFTPKYYEVIGHMADVVTITDENRVILKKTYPIAIKKHITGAEDQVFEHGKSDSKAVMLYLSEQNTAIQHILQDANKALSATTPAPTQG